MTAMIGDHVTSVLRQLELPFRVASDHNLYTRAEFVAHYGKSKGDVRWTWAVVSHRGFCTVVSGRWNSIVSSGD